MQRCLKGFVGQVFLISSALAVFSGCGGNGTPDRPRHACQSLESEQARGRTDQELARSRQQIADRREGCDQANQFMVMLTASFMQRGVSVSETEALRYGARFCQNRFQDSRHDSHRSGCGVGVTESVTFTPGVADFFGNSTGGVPNPRTTPAPLADADRARAEQAFVAASRLTSRLDERRRQVNNARQQLEAHREAVRTRDAARADIATAEGEAVAAESRAADLLRRQNEIFSARRVAEQESLQAQNAALRAQQRNQEGERRLANAQSATRTALQQRQIAESQLAAILSQIDGLNRQARRDYSEALRLEDIMNRDR